MLLSFQQTHRLSGRWNTSTASEEGILACSIIDAVSDLQDAAQSKQIQKPSSDMLILS